MQTCVMQYHVGAYERHTFAVVVLAICSKLRVTLIHFAKLMSSHIYESFSINW